MKIPNRIKFMGQVWRVVYEDDLVTRTGCIGESRYNTLEIALQSGMLQSTTEQTFMHELLHIIMFKMGETENRQDEKFIDVTASMIYAILVDNKMVV